MEQTKDAKAVFDNNAAEYEAKFMDLTTFHASFDLFCGSVKKPNPAIFEMACGPGNITQYLLKQRPDFKLLGTDTSPNMLQLAKANNPIARFELMDCRQLSQHSAKYDGIVSGFVLPYLNPDEVEQLFKDMYDKLLVDGVFYLSTMVDATSRSEYVKPSSGKGMALLTHYYAVSFLEEIMHDIGFEIIDSDFISSPHYQGTKVKDWWVVARKTKVLNLLMY